MPAFVGLGAPYWDAEARGAIVGLTRGATRAHLVRATLEAIAFQTRDVVRCLARRRGRKRARSLRVDGGAAANDFLMQFQADVLGVPVERPEGARDHRARRRRSSPDSASGSGVRRASWTAMRTRATRFSPRLAPARRDALYRGWQDAVRRVRGAPPPV